MLKVSQQNNSNVLKLHDQLNKPHFKILAYSNVTRCEYSFYSLAQLKMVTVLFKTATQIILKDIKTKHFR